LNRINEGPSPNSGEQPLVSVILPVYNGERFVAETLESALRQTYRNLEIIIIDDGSTDRTNAVLQSLAAGDPRVHVFTQSNGGVASARNRGLAEAHGEFIAPLDADDLWDPTKIERQVRRMQEAGEETGMVYCWWVWIDECGVVRDRSPEWKIEGEGLEMLLQVNYTGNASVPLYRRRCLEEAGGYDETFERRGGQGCEDWDVALKVATRFRVAVVPELLTGYRRLPESMSTQCVVMRRSQEFLAEGVVERQPEISPELLQRSADQFALYLAAVLFRSGKYFAAFIWAIRAWHTGLLFRVLPYMFRIFRSRIRFGRSTARQVMRPGIALNSAAIPGPLIPYDRVYGQAEKMPDRTGALLRSLAVQACVVVLSFCLVFWLHRGNDGLWFQGDAPRHAANGLFWYDMLAARTTAGMDFAVRYYARYPIINPLMYPPLFYLLEGLTFRIFGPSPYAAKVLILIFAIVMGLYTMQWARRWLGPPAGWSGAFLAFVPGVMIWSNTVVLNIPATALGVACLYHWRSWFDSGARKDLAIAATFAVAAVLTYYQAGIVIAIALVWSPLLRRTGRHTPRRPYAIAGLGVLLGIPVLLAAALAPLLFTRSLPTLRTLNKPETWTFYPASLPALLGPALVILGALGLAFALCDVQIRKEAQLLAAWIAGTIGAFSLLPAKDSRYILIVAPAAVLAATLGLMALARRLSRISSLCQAMVLALALAGAGWSATRLQIPQKSGFRAVAAYLKSHAPHEAVLYDGYHDGLFGFYFRAADPGFQRRLVLGQQILYHYGPKDSFYWVETLEAKSTAEIANLLRTKSGCRWVAIEVGANSNWAQGQRLLRHAVAQPGFELVRSFPLIAPNAERVDLYRLTGPVAPVPLVTVRVTSFSDNTFSRVQPVSR
jgi:glycosyltransferase involved in cell wall biosynthesis